MLFAISPLFRLFALRRFAEGQGDDHVQRATARTAPSFALSRTRRYTALHGPQMAKMNMNVLMRALRFDSIRILNHIKGTQHWPPQAQHDMTPVPLFFRQVVLGAPCESG